MGKSDIIKVGVFIMKTKVLLVFAIFIISVFLAACNNNDKIDVDKYRENVKKSQKKSMPIEQRDEIEKSIFPNIDKK